MERITDLLAKRDGNKRLKTFFSWIINPRATEAV
jgi:hypothetical protein